MLSIPSAFTSSEQRLIKLLSTPEKVQAYINTNFAYRAKNTVKSFRRTLNTKSCHCLEGAIFAATALVYHNYPALLLTLEARDVDHIVFLFKHKGYFGAIGQSKHKELKYRAPIYATVRDLVMSYFPFYYNVYSNKPGRRMDYTLRGYAVTDLSQFEEDWQTSSKDLEVINSYLFDIPHRKLFTSNKSVFYRCNHLNVITEL